jgi:hypothetical protein
MSNRTPNISAIQEVPAQLATISSHSICAHTNVRTIVGFMLANKNFFAMNESASSIRKLFT